MIKLIKNIPTIVLSLIIIFLLFWSLFDIHDAISFLNTLILIIKNI